MLQRSTKIRITNHKHQNSSSQQEHTKETWVLLAALISLVQTFPPPFLQQVPASLKDALQMHQKGLLLSAIQGM